MKIKIIVIIVVVAILAITAFFIFSGKDDKPKVGIKNSPVADPMDAYKGPNVIKQTVKLKNIPRFRKVIEQQEKEK